MAKESNPNVLDTFYMDEDPTIRKTLEEGKFCVVVGEGTIDKQIRQGITITSDDCKVQAEWSIDQRKFAPFTLRYLNRFKNYADWTEETLKVRPAFSKADKQLIGLIELFAGTIQYYRHAGKGFPLIFLEEPETHLHPQEQREIISVIQAIRDEFGEKK